MNKEIIDVLEEKFSKDKIKKRPGSFGKTLDYIEAHEVLKRANRAFKGDWSFELLTSPKEMLIDGNNIVAHVRVTYIDPETNVSVHRDGIGGKKITFLKQNDRDVEAKAPRVPLDLANDIKASTSDAIKKAFSTFGIGLDLYGSDDDDKDDDKAPQKVEKEEVVTDGPALPEQISAIEKMSKAKRVDGKFWVSNGHAGLENAKINLTQKQAKDLIVKLNEYK